MIDDLVRSTATIGGVVRQEVVSVTTGNTTSNCAFPSKSGDPNIELRPCGGVGVTASNGTQTFRTTSSTGDGSYVLTGLPPGTYSMTFERAGYTTVLFTTTVAAGEVLDLPTTDMKRVPTGDTATGSARLFVGSVANLPLTGITVQVIGQMDSPLSFTAAPPVRPRSICPTCCPAPTTCVSPRTSTTTASPRCRSPSAARPTPRCC